MGWAAAARRLLSFLFVNMSFKIYCAFRIEHRGTANQ